METLGLLLVHAKEAALCPSQLQPHSGRQPCSECSQGHPPDYFILSPGGAELCGSAFIMLYELSEASNPLHGEGSEAGRKRGKGK